MTTVFIAVGCSCSEQGNPTEDRSSTNEMPLRLGDSKAVMLEKMEKIGARDVTSQTKYLLTEARTREQETFWWELQDETIVGVNLLGKDKSNLVVGTIEISEVGAGIKCIPKWRSQKLTTLTEAGERVPAGNLSKD